MTTRPTEPIEWAENGPNPAQGSQLPQDPGSALRATGYGFRNPIPHEEFNWLHRTIGRWIKYLEGGSFSSVKDFIAGMVPGQVGRFARPLQSSYEVARLRETTLADVAERIFVSDGRTLYSTNSGAGVSLRLFDAEDPATEAVWSLNDFGIDPTADRFLATDGKTLVLATVDTSDDLIVLAWTIPEGGFDLSDPNRVEPTWVGTGAAAIDPVIEVTGAVVHGGQVFVSCGAVEGTFRFNAEDGSGATKNTTPGNRIMAADEYYLYYSEPGTDNLVLRSRTNYAVIHQANAAGASVPGFTTKDEGLQIAIDQNYIYTAYNNRVSVIPKPHPKFVGNILDGKIDLVATTFPLSLVAVSDDGDLVVCPRELGATTLRIYPDAARGTGLFQELITLVGDPTALEAVPFDIAVDPHNVYTSVEFDTPGFSFAALSKPSKAPTLLRRVEGDDPAKSISSLAVRA